MSVGRAANIIENPFLTLQVRRLFLSNALPMAVVMSTSGLLNVVEGIFVGRFIGAHAFAAVSLAFPVVMLLTALPTLAGGGMSSLLARYLGKGSRREAGAVFAAAHGLAHAMSLVVILDLGIAGSAIGTVAAPTLSLALLLLVRKRNPALLPLSAIRHASWLTGWRQILLLVVTTDRRTYMIELRAREALYMPSVAWAYPAPPAGQRQSVPAATNIPTEAARNYRYGLTGDSPPWRPISVFDDGRRVYVVFLRGIVRGEMPPIFVLGADGEPQVIDSRIYQNILIPVISAARSSTRRSAGNRLHRPQ